MRKNNSGFSLIELSIVLIIIGLLVVGAVKGYALYVSAKVLRLNQELTKYAFASEQFTALYGTYPGLLTNAKEKFGSKAKVKIDENKKNKDSVNEGGKPTGAESINFFNHLSLAGLLDEGENYIGTDADLTSTNSITYDSEYYPRLKSFKNLYPYVRGDDIDGSFNTVNRIVLAGYNGDDEGVDGSIIMSLDTKFDDGSPLSGNVALIPDTSFSSVESGE